LSVKENLLRNKLVSMI